MDIQRFSDPWSLKKYFLVFFLLLAIVGAVFGNTFLNEWTYDDFPVILKNPDIGSFQNFLDNRVQGRPIRELTYFVDNKIFGKDPFGYHFQQILWHALNGFLVFWILLKVGVKPAFSFVSALFFLIHPVQVASVASVGHRKELLALFFGLLFWFFYIKAAEKEEFKAKGLFLGLCFLSLVLAYYSNYTVLAIALVVPLYEYLFLVKDSRIVTKNIYTCLAFFLLLGSVFVYLLTKIDMKSNISTIYSKYMYFDSMEYSPIVFTSFKSFFLYVSKIVYPVGLAPEYFVSISEGFDSLVGIGVFLIILFLCISFAFRRKMPLLSLGLVWVVLLYLPVSNIVPVKYLLADRYAYMMVLGFSFVLASMLQRVNSQKLLIFSCFLILSLSFLTINQNLVWGDRLTLWEYAESVNPKSLDAKYAYARALDDSGRLGKAKDFYSEILKKNRFKVPVYLDLAKLEEKMGNYKIAYIHYKQYISLAKLTNPRKAKLVQEYLLDFEQNIVE